MIAQMTDGWCLSQVVLKDRDGAEMTLREVFASLNLTAYDLNVDMLDVHAVSITGRQPAVLPRLRSCPLFSIAW